MSHRREIAGSVVVVTGASAGIGRATALAFARRGAALVLASRRLNLLEGLADEMRSHGRRAIAVACDVSEWQQVESLRDRTREEFGRCDVLVNNAGIPGGGRFADVPIEQIERVIRTNYLGVVYGTKAFLPMMLEAGHGHVVNVASLAGRYAAPGSSIYSSTKHAVVAFSESLHHEVAERGVAVTSVNPAFVPTEAFRAEGRPGLLVLTAERVAGDIAKVVRDGIAPEYSIPRWAAAGQLFRLLTPRMYRRTLARAARPRPVPELE